MMQAVSQLIAGFRRHRGAVALLVAAVALLSLAGPAWAVGASLAAPAAEAALSGVVQPAEPSVLEAVLFYLTALGLLICVLGVCVAKSIVRMAVWLFLSLGMVGLVYFLLAAPLLGAIQLIVYVGGTAILLVFGVMLTSQSPWLKYETPPLERYGAALVSLVLFAALCVLMGGAKWAGVEAAAPGVGVEELGVTLVTRYVLPFELAGVLLFVVMVGAAHLARETKK